MINCQKCQETSCAKQVSKQKLTVLTCTAYKAKKVNMTQKEPKENKLFESVEQLSKNAQDLVRRKKELSQRTWQGLTDKAITQVIDSMPKNMKGFMVDWDLYEFAQTIEAKLKQKNGYAEEKNK